LLNYGTKLRKIPLQALLSQVLFSGLTNIGMLINKDFPI